MNGTFIPGTSLPGAYVYRVIGTPPCADATAVVTVNVVAEPIAGTDGTASVCSNEVAFPLIGRLGGTPATNGTWSGPGGHPRVFSLREQVSPVSSPTQFLGPHPVRMPLPL